MAIASASIAGDAVASLEGAASSLSGVTLCQQEAEWVANQITQAFDDRCAEMAFLLRPAEIDEDGQKREAWVKSVWAMTRAEELVGEIKQSDHTVFINPVDVEQAGFPRPLRQGDILVRWKADPTREHAHTALETPGLFTVGGVDVLYRLIVRG